MNKEQLREELKEVKELYFVGNESWSRFDVYYVKNGRLWKLWIDEQEKDLPSFWVKLHYTRSGRYVGGYFSNNVIGSDRTYEIAENLSMWLFGEPHRFKAVNLYFIK